MSFSIGIVGLPNVGKSTLFKILTKKSVDIAPYPFTTINPNIGIVQVPDERLNKISEIIKPEKITSATIQFVDIAGLIKNAHKGEGLGNQFLAQIRNCDAILEVIRGFENPEVENILNDFNPKKEREIIKNEFLMKDLEILENLIQKTEIDLKKEKKLLKKLNLLKKFREEIFQGKLISEIKISDDEKIEIKEYQFLTQKPIFYILNIDKKRESCPSGIIDCLEINLKEEEKIFDLSIIEIKEFGLKSQIDQLIMNCYNALNLITFYTIAGGKEVRARTLKKGSLAPEAGEIVHSDFKENFIKAEVISWEKLIKSGNWKEAREIGEIKIVGKNYIVEDGDIIEFKI